MHHLDALCVSFVAIVVAVLLRTVHLLDDDETRMSEILRVIRASISSSRERVCFVSAAWQGYPSVG